jgi:hypothetical protein
MGKGVAGAFGLILLWLAFVAFFVAFHPGGIKLADGTPAQNPRDVVIYLIQRLTGGFGESKSSTATADENAPAPATTVVLWRTITGRPKVPSEMHRHRVDMRAPVHAHCPVVVTPPLEKLRPK